MKSQQTTTPELCNPQPARDWRESLVRDAKGNPCATLNNCLIAMCESGEFPFKYWQWYKVHSEIWFAGDHPRNWRVLGTELGQFRSWLESHQIFASTTTIKQALLVYAKGDGLDAFRKPSEKEASA